MKRWKDLKLMNREILFSSKKDDWETPKDLFDILNDELYTPDYAIKPLLKYLPKDLTIWECTDFGNSNISKILKSGGIK